jgi:type IV pilus assembly protein PilQ
MNRAILETPSGRSGARWLMGAISLMVAAGALAADAVPPSAPAQTSGAAASQPMPAQVSATPAATSAATPAAIPVAAVVNPAAPDATAPAASTNQLESIDVQPLGARGTRLTMHMSAPAPQPVSFALEKPARISFDLPNTTLALPSRRIDVSAGGIGSILAAEAGGRSRVVLELNQPEPYQASVSGNDIVVLLGAGGGGGSEAQSAGTTGARGGSAFGAAGPMVRSIDNIDFRRGENGAAQLVVQLSDPHTPIDLKQQGSQIVINFAGTSLPKRLTRRYDTLDFATPVSGFEAERIGANARIVMDATGNFDQLAYQSDKQYVVEVAPIRQAAQNGTAEVKKSYKGERLTLNFQDISTRAVLQLLADASGQNIVVSDNVNGSVTLRLQNVPWDQALDIVLRTKGLGQRQEGNVILVAPADELAAREKADMASQQDIQQLEPLRSEYLQLNYAKASEVATLLKGHTNGQTSTIMSTRGSVSVDERTNTLLLQDTPERLADVRRLVGMLDIPVRQVEIEARIVIVNNDFERQLGSVLGLTANSTNGLFSTSGTSAGLPSNASTTFSGLSGATAINSYNVNLPTTTSAGSIAFGILGSNYLVDLELSAAQTENLATVVSSPRVITANQQEASIKQGIEIPYQQSASSGATTIAFKDAVLLLKVKPLITPDNRIILDLNISDDSVGQVVVASGGVNVPAIDTRAVTTQVLLSDGETVVLGGILETTQSKAATKVPWLGDIPIFGTLFRSTTDTNNKDEMLIFVTPKILREDAR